MKHFAILLLLGVVAATYVVAVEFPSISTTEAATPPPTTSSSSSSTTSNSKNGGDDENSTTSATPTQGGEPFHFKVNELHRIPVFEDAHPNPPVETISKLESLAREATAAGDEKKKPEVTTSEATSPVLESSNKTDNNKTSSAASSSESLQFELPIPSRCPAITGTADPESSGKDPVMAMLEASNEPKAAQRGCRFFIMHELMQRSKTVQQQPGSEVPEHHDEVAHFEKILHECFKTCVEAYDNGTDLARACSMGCSKTARATEAAKDILTGSGGGDELEREGEEHSHEQPEMHRSFSIIIPLRPMDPSMAPVPAPSSSSPFSFSSNNGQDQTIQQQQGGSSSFPAMMPNAIKMMLTMMHQMTERARQSMMTPSQDDASTSLVREDGGSSMDGGGNSISVSRSMSVLVTKDQDGHSKMVVVHTLPKVQIHRFQGHSFFDDDDDELPFGDESKEHTASNSPSASDTDDSDSDTNAFDTDDLRVHLFVSKNHLLGEDGHGIQQQNPNNPHEHGKHHHQREHGKDGSNQHAQYYRSKLCYYLPRLFYLTLLILVLYVIFWLFCAVPTAFASRRRGAEAGGGVAIIATGGDGKRKKFFFTKNQKYFQLNNKRLSTTSLPPPYPGMEDEEEADALPEKQPLPQDHEAAKN